MAQERAKMAIWRAKMAQEGANIAIWRLFGELSLTFFDVLRAIFAEKPAA